MISELGSLNIRWSIGIPVVLIFESSVKYSQLSYANI